MSFWLLFAHTKSNPRRNAEQPQNPFYLHSFAPLPPCGKDGGKTKVKRFELPIGIGDNPSVPARHLPQGELGEARERVARAITQGRLFLWCALKNQPQFTICLHPRHDLAKNLLYHKISKGVTPDAISPS